MHHFAYRDGTLFAEDVDLSALADRVGTPFYVYSTATLERHYHVLERAFGGLDHMICYSAKANSNIAVLKTLGALGAGLDIVSEGELHRAAAAGIAPEKIVFSGVGKTRGEMMAALDAGIFCFNVESEAELKALSGVASKAGKTASIALRVNPDVDAGSHTKISTGRASDKFGIAWADAREVYSRAADLPGLEVAGVDMHIGSQIFDLEPYRQAFGKLGQLVAELRRDGHDISHVDLGGGLGIPYRAGDAPPDPEQYAQTIAGLVAELDCKIVIEPGRVIAGNAGILVGRVLYVKAGALKNFVIVDAAMNDLMRPTLYDAHHEIIPVREAGAPRETITADIVGPICETGDFLARDRELPALEAGDLIAIMSAGAYGAVLSNSYNSRPLAPEILVKGADWSIVRPRPGYDSMLAAENLAGWQA
jgi:diaminopimelate decarboxylase